MADPVDIRLKGIEVPSQDGKVMVHMLVKHQDLVFVQSIAVEFTREQVMEMKLSDVVARTYQELQQQHMDLAYLLEKRIGPRVSIEPMSNQVKTEPEPTPFAPEDYLQSKVRLLELELAEERRLRQRAEAMLKRVDEILAVGNHYQPTVPREMYEKS